MRHGSCPKCCPFSPLFVITWITPTVCLELVGRVRAPGSGSDCETFRLY